MKKLVSIVLAGLFAATGAMAADKYPARDITDAVVWGAGGGTDVCNRTILLINPC